MGFSPAPYTRCAYATQPSHRVGIAMLYRGDRVVAILPLIAGSALAVKQDRTAILCFYKGARFSLNGGGKVLITPNHCEPLSGPHPLRMRPLPDWAAAPLQRSRVAGDPSATLILRHGPRYIELHSLYNTSILESLPLFKWQLRTSTSDNSSKLIYYTVQVRDRERTVWTGETTKDTIDYPRTAPELKPEVPYTWTVATLIDGEPLVHKGFFQILNKGDCEAAKAALGRLHSLKEITQDETLLKDVLSADIYEQYDLQDDALQSYEDLSNHYPEVATFHLILADMLQRVGRDSESQAQLNIAQRLVTAN